MTNITVEKPAVLKTRDDSFHPWIRICLLLATFFIVLLPILPSPTRFHGDERFYTDAALQMLRTGDYWTPFYPDGQMRLNKPILTYWMASGSMWLFGISLFAVRLPFLLAGVLTVWLTFLLARAVLNSGRAALLASLIVASNVELMTLSTRATPDVFLCLFILASWWGFARIWFQEDKTLVGTLLAFGGMGLAVQTKGLVGLCPLAASALFWVLARQRAGPRIRVFLKWPAIAVGLGLGLFWYAIMLHRHGLGAMQDFYSDQVGTKVTRNPGFMFANVAVYLFAGFRHFLPWTLLPLAAAIWFPRQLAKFWKTHRRECLFLFSLFAVLVVSFSFGNVRRPRYLTASYPMLAVLLAAVVSSIATQQGLQRWISRIIRVLALLAALIGAGLLLAGLESDWRLAVGGSVLAACGLGGLMAAISSNETARWVWGAAVFMIAFGLVGACIRPVFSPSPLADIAESLRQSKPPDGRIYTWRTTDNTASQLRLLAGGELVVIPLGEKVEVADFRGAGTVITTSPHQEVLGRTGYHLSRVANANPALVDSWLGRLTAGIAAKAHKHPPPSYWIAVRNPPGQSDSQNKFPDRVK